MRRRESRRFSRGHRARRAVVGPRARASPRGAAKAWERGSGTVLAVALLGAIVVATGAALFAVAVLAAQRQVQNAADTAALAAADTLSGRAAGYPCENAERAATLNGASVTSCSNVGLIAAVTAARNWGGLRLQAGARAGPPGGGCCGQTRNVRQQFRADAPSGVCILSLQGARASSLIHYSLYIGARVLCSTGRSARVEMSARSREARGEAPVSR